MDDSTHHKQFVNEWQRRTSTYPQMDDSTHVQRVYKQMLMRADLYEDAAKRLVKRGWIQNEFGAASTGYCVSGAMRAELCRPDKKYLPLYVSLMFDSEVNPFPSLQGDLLAYIWSNPGAFEIGAFHTLTLWNDLAGRTKAEVVCTLRGAAQSLRETHRLTRRLHGQESVI